MPELPDVEIFKRYIDATSLHKKIDEVEVRAKDILEGVSSRTLKKALQGHSFERTARHGKQLFVAIKDGDWLTMHFGMTGDLKYFKNMDDDTPHDRMLISFSNGYHLAYDNQRKLGAIGLVKDVNTFIQDHDLGPDALEDTLDFEAFQEAVAGGRATIKSALMNQQRIAGIGNVYSDEILFQAGIRPDITTDDLDRDHLRHIYRSMKHVLRTAIERQADPDQMPKSWIIPHRRGDRVCPKCGGDIKDIRVSGRTAYYCPEDQKK